MKPLLDQRWSVRFTDTEVLIVGEDETTVARLLRPDHGSDLLVAGYIIGMQLRALSDVPA